MATFGYKGNLMTKGYSLLNKDHTGRGAPNPSQGPGLYRYNISLPSILNLWHLKG